MQIWLFVCRERVFGFFPNALYPPFIFSFAKQIRISSTDRPCGIRATGFVIALVFVPPELISVGPLVMVFFRQLEYSLLVTSIKALDIGPLYLFVTFPRLMKILPLSAFLTLWNLSKQVSKKYFSVECFLRTFALQLTLEWSVWLLSTKSLW